MVLLGCVEKGFSSLRFPNVYKNETVLGPLATEPLDVGRPAAMGMPALAGYFSSARQAFTVGAAVL
jgi:hypothetical protein